MTESQSVLLFIDHFGSGGAQRQLVTIANGLARNGFDVHIAIYYPKHNHYRSLVSKDVKVIELEKKGRFDITLIFKLLMLLYKNRYGTAMAFLHTPGFYLEVSSMLYLRRLHLVYSERSAEFFWANGISKVRHLLHRLCGAITSNSRSQAKTLKQRYPTKKVEYIANAISDSFFNRALSEKVISERLRSKKIVVLAHAAPFKNYRYLAYALKEYERIFQKKPPVIYWYGEVRKEDGVIKEMEFVNRFLVDNDLQDYLVFPGVCHDAEQLLSEAFLLMHPSKYESSSNSVNEALSSGVPVVVGDIPEHIELSKWTESAIHFDLSDPVSLAVQLDELLSLNIEDYSRLCYQARSYALSQHDESIVLRKYIDVLNCD